MPWGTVREALCKKPEGILPQMNFVPWIVLGCNCVPPVLNIYIHFILTGCQFIAIEPNSVKGYSECCPQRTQSGYGFQLAFILSQIRSIVYARRNCFYEFVYPEKFWERAVLSIFSMCLLAFIYTYFPDHVFLTSNNPLDHCFLCHSHI